MRVLAVDHGTARAGCAICDPLETVVRPLDVVEPPEPSAVARLAEASGAELVVVGVPVSLDGSEGAQAQLARRFRDELSRELDIPVETYDERLTTRMAASSSREGAEGAPDAIAAAHLLEGFLAWRSRPGAGSAAPAEGPAAS
jgi:putative Holliday junction resolvase